MNSEETPTTTTNNSNLNQDSPNCSTSEIEFDDLEANIATTAPAVDSADNDLDLSNHHHQLQQQKGGAYSLTTAQQIISNMDTSNFILQEQKQQERSINGDDLLVTMVTADDMMTTTTPASINELESKSNGLLSVNGVNLVSSSSSSVTSSMSSSMEPPASNKNLLIEDEMNNNIERPLPVAAENNLIDIGDYETVNSYANMSNNYQEPQQLMHADQEELLNQDSYNDLNAGYPNRFVLCPFFNCMRH